MPVSVSACPSLIAFVSGYSLLVWVFVPVTVLVPISVSLSGPVTLLVFVALSLRELLFHIEVAIAF